MIELCDFTYMCRVHYLAASDEVWGEHEIDYILILQKDLPLNPSPNEVADTRYVTADELKQLIATADSKQIKLTPWFQVVSQIGLYTWWENLSDLAPLIKHEPIIRG